MGFSELAMSMYGNAPAEQSRTLSDLPEEQSESERTEPNPIATPDQGGQAAPEVAQPATESAIEAQVVIEDGEIVPDAPDGYDLPGNPDPALADWFRNLAADEGLTRGQAFNLARQHEQMAAKQAADFDAKVTAFQAETRAGLEAVWGPATNENIEAARHAARELESDLPGFSKWFGLTGMGDDPMFVRLIHLVASKAGAGRGSLADSLYSKR